MLDLLNLPGIKPVDMYKESKALIIVAVADETEVPICPDCKTPMHKHGTRKKKFSDTPLYMAPVRLEVQRPRFRCESCGKMAIPELRFLDDKRRAAKAMRLFRQRYYILHKHARLLAELVQDVKRLNKGLTFQHC